MSARPERPVRVGGALALAVGVVAVVVLSGAMAGPPGVLAGLVGGLSAVVVGAGLRELVDDDNRSRALGSVGLGLGATGVVTAVSGLVYAAGLPDGHPLGHPMADGLDAVVVLVAVVGVLATAADAFVEAPSRAREEVGAVVWRSTHLLFVGGVLGYLVAVGLFVDVPVAVVAVGSDLLAAAGTPTTAGGTALAAALVVLQVLAVVVLWVVRRAVPALDEWVASATTTREDATEVAELLRVLPSPRGRVGEVFGLLSVQATALVVAGESVGWVVTAVLDAFGPLGTGLRVAVATGALHWPLVAAGVLAGVVLAVDGLRSAVTLWAGRSPPTTLAFAAGGAVGAGLALVAGLVATVVEVVFAVQVDAPLVAPAVAVVVGVGLVTTTLLTALLGRLAWFGGLRRATGFAGGAAALFVAALAVPLFGPHGTSGGALGGLVPLAAVGGVAASLLVWDLGENSVALRSQLGRETGTREVELTHAVGSLLVAAGSVVLAVVTYYLAGPLLFAGVAVGPLRLDGGLVEVGSERAFVALGLTIVALLAFGALLDRGRHDPK